ncbi:MAG: DUF7734 family protein [cyanobacterium endosymbiont of Rhopalodia musculus]
MFKGFSSFLMKATGFKIKVPLISKNAILLAIDYLFISYTPK